MKVRLRFFIAGIVIFCIMFTGYRMLFGKGSVFAAEENCLIEASQDQGEAAWQDQNGEWQFGSFTEAVKNVSSKGTVVLLSDVSLTSPIAVSKPMVITSNEVEKPCVIKNVEQDTDDRQNRGRIFTVTGGELRLQNIILDGGRKEGVTAYHPLICVSGSNAFLRLLDGAILQNAENVSQSLCGGGINIRRGQSYLHEDSQIRNCKARHGGGVEVNSNSTYTLAVLWIVGGSINGCEADDGGGVYVNIGILRMQGGEIIDNRAMKADTGGQRTGGGGIYIAGGSGATKVGAVLVEKGEISDNKAESDGGGILVQGGYTLIEMWGGMLKGNKAKCGGGISVILGTLKMQGGTVTGNKASSYGGGILSSPNSVIELKANPRVFDNTSGDTADRFDNFYLDGNEEEGTASIQLTDALTDGVQLGMSRWVRPDEKEHPYREMFVPGKTYKITQSDFDRLCDDRKSNYKELYADNMEKYALIPYDGKIVMVQAVDIALDQKSISLEKEEDTAALKASVKPDNAPVKEVKWSSSDEEVATVDEDGVVTAVRKGKAIITATTVSPYHEKASCKVTVGKFYYQLATKAVHGEILPASGESHGIVEEKERVAFRLVPDKGYQLKEGSLRACRMDNEQVPVSMEGEILYMPDHDVIVTAEFEPVIYPITCYLEGGTLTDGAENPDSYTIESDEITLNNPVRSGYRFVGWMGTEVTETENVVKILSGSIGAREYTAVWEAEEDEPLDPDQPIQTENPEPTEDPEPTENPGTTAQPEPTMPSGSSEQTGLDKKEDDVSTRPAVEEDKVGKTEKTRTYNTQPAQNPKTGSRILWMYAALLLSGAGMLILTFLYKKWRKR